MAVLEDEVKTLTGLASFPLDLGIPAADTTVLSTKQDYDDLFNALNIIRGVGGIQNITPSAYDTQTAPIIALIDAEFANAVTNKDTYYTNMRTTLEGSGWTDIQDADTSGPWKTVIYTWAAASVAK